MARKRRPGRPPAPGPAAGPNPHGGGAAGRAPGEGSPHVPRWLPPTLFVILTLVVFREFVLSDLMLVGNDTLSLGLVARGFYDRALTELGDFPLWNPLILGGTPFIEALAGGDSLYPPSLLLLLLMETHRALGWKLVLHVLAAGFFMFGWARTLGTSRAAALVAGVGYMLAPFLVSLVHPGHDGKLFVTALTPLLFWAVERHFVRPRATTFAATAAVIALVILTTHFQMAYFLFGAVGLYAIFRTAVVWRGGGEGATEAGEVGSPPPGKPGSPGDPEPSARYRAAPALARFGLFLAAALVGAGMAGVQLIPAVDYVTESSRRIQTTREAAGDVGVAWSSSYSFHPEETLALLVPEFAGNNAGGSDWSRGTYWGRNGFRDNSSYAGIVILLLAAVSFAGGARRRLRWFFTGLGLLALLFALGTHTPVWRAFYELVPGIRLFRAPDQVMFLFGFGAATLAALGADRLLGAAAADDEASWKGVGRTLAGATGVLAVIALLASSGALTAFWTSAIYTDVQPGQLAALETLRPFIARGAWLATILAAGVGGLAWALRSGHLAPVGVLAGLLLLVAVDEIRVDGTFVQTMDYHRWAQPDPNMRALLERHEGDPEPYRLLSLSGRGQDVKPALYGIELAAGHHPNDLSRYRELIGMVGSTEPQNLLASQQIRRLLNVRYILWPDWQLGPAPAAGAVSRSQLADGRVYETLLAEAGLPRARLVGRAVVLSDEEAVPYMLSDAFDPEREAVLAEEPPLALDGEPVEGAVTWEERGLDRLRLSVSTDRPALLVIADNWYPAWRATVDGAEAPVLRAYHTLRAVPVEAGEHMVELEYRSALLAASAWLSVVLTLLVAGAAAGQVVLDRRRGRPS